MAPLAIHGAKSSEVGTVNSPTFWAASTAVFALVAYILVWPNSCADVEKCVSVHGSISSNFNSHTVCGLVFVLIMEFSSLVSTYQGVRQTNAMVPEIRSRCMPSFLLVCMFTVLVGQHTVFSSGLSPWYANTPETYGVDNVLHGRPVYTLTVVEWLVIVPVLLVMAGHCALGRPMTEITKPVLLTNFYIVLAWSAQLTTNESVRWTLVSITFVMYGVASLYMLQWVADYFQEAPRELSNRTLRPCLSVGLIALFAAYGVIYMTSIVGILSSRTERMAYLFFDVGAKLAMSAAFVVIRTREYHTTFSSLLQKMSSSNIGLVSILRGSFDFVIPCNLDAEGGCRMPSVRSADTRSLGSVLGRELEGLDIGGLLADDRERAAFQSYVSNTMRQAQNFSGLQKATLTPDGDWAGAGQSQLPPIAQVLNCSLAATSMTPKGSVRKPIQCSIHLSVVPRFALSLENKWQIVAAVRLHDVAVPEAVEVEVEEQQKKKHIEEEDSMSSLVASLSDVAKLGASNLLVSQRGGSTEISGTETAESESVLSRPAPIRAPSEGKNAFKTTVGKIDVVEEDELEDAESASTLTFSRNTTEENRWTNQISYQSGASTKVPPAEEIMWGPVPPMHSDGQNKKNSSSKDGKVEVMKGKSAKGACLQPLKSAAPTPPATTTTMVQANSVPLAVASTSCKVSETVNDFAKQWSSTGPILVGVLAGTLASFTVLSVGGRRH